MPTTLEVSPSCLVSTLRVCWVSWVMLDANVTCSSGLIGVSISIEGEGRQVSFSWASFSILTLNSAGERCPPFRPGIADHRCHVPLLPPATVFLQKEPTLIVMTKIPVF